MKRGKDEEKTMGPMFPRLHVNDTADKGGPRAPPRNKMALYEQLSIPSQRFGSGSVPHNPQNNKSSFMSSASSSQVSGVERDTVFSNNLASSTTTLQWSEKFPAIHSHGTNSPAAQFERKKKVGDEDDFTVPVFVQSRIGKSLSNTHNSEDRGNFSSISSALSRQPEEEHINTSDEVLKHTNLMNADVRKIGNRTTESMKSGGRNGNCTAMETDTSLREAKEDSDEEYRVRGLPNFSASCHGEENGEPKELENDNERDGSSLQFENADKGDDISETSMVDSASALDITPDDVVGVIGQKRFWKARKEIVNQQRVFAVQVFELHRLIKVQRLIAGSPHILIEDGLFLGKPSTKGSPIEKLAAELVTKPPPSSANCKDDSEKPSHKRERYTENTVEKRTLSSAKSGSQSVNYGHCSAQPQLQPQPHPQPQPQLQPQLQQQHPQQEQLQQHQQPMGMTNDSKTNPWYFPQPPGGPQWLVPVMSPSEGLVYKPYTGPGVSGPVYGGYGPYGPIPMPGNYPNPAYGALPPQPIGGFPGTSLGGPIYFPTYGIPGPTPTMSGSAVEQATHFARPTAQAQPGQVAEQQSSCTAPPSQPRESSVSSCREIHKGDRSDRNSQARDPVPIPVCGASSQPNRVIKVVPHNPRTATESAARIFRIIQEERLQNDGV